MATEYDSLNGYGALVANGTSGSRYKQAFETPPSGTNAMTVVMSAWWDGPTTNVDFAETVAFPCATYFGMSFSGTHIDTPDSTEAQYANFIGSAMIDSSAPFTRVELEEATGGGVIRSHFLGGTSLTTAQALSAYSTPIDSALGGASAIDYPFALASNETYGRSRTMVWHFYTSLVDNSVFSRFYVNNESIDTKSFDIDSIDSNDPRNTISVYSTYQRSPTIHGDVFGTNWRPTDGGDMAFPTHFLARWGGSQHSMIINDIKVKYATITS